MSKKESGKSVLDLERLGGRKASSLLQILLAAGQVLEPAREGQVFWWTRSQGHFERPSFQLPERVRSHAVDSRART